MNATGLRVRTATPADVDDIFRLIGALRSGPEQHGTQFLNWFL